MSLSIPFRGSIAYSVLFRGIPSRTTLRIDVTGERLSITPKWRLCSSLVSRTVSKANGRLHHSTMAADARPIRMSTAWSSASLNPRKARALAIVVSLLDVAGAMTMST